MEKSMKNEINNSRETQEIAHEVILKLQRRRRKDLIKSGELVEDNFEEPTRIETQPMQMKELIEVPRKSVYRTIESFFSKNE